MGSTKKFYLILLLILSFTLIPLTGVIAEEVIAYIGEVGGDVSVTRSSTSSTDPVTPGMFLNAGDMLKTGAESFASIIFQDDGSRVKLGANSQLTLNATRREDRLEKSSFLQMGKLWAKVTKRKGTSFQVKTPTSVASVKGTRFIMEEKEWGETWLYVLEDSVLLAIASEEKEIEEGQKGKATKDKIEIEDIQKDDLPIEPGIHKMIFYLKKSGATELQKEVHVEFEVK